jgi:uncharacterized membrane protein YdjX (TVP38/TMEM64 family)
VIGAKSLANESVGLATGTLIAIVIGSAAKLTACCGQYGIGFLLGKSVKVQQLIGVDKVFTRSLEQILKTRGLGIGKVAILVGGPDWPTSVSCGILRLNIPQMLLGTLPVIIVSIAPQTLVGALLNKETDGVLALVSNAATGGAALAQAGAMLLAMYHITRTMEKDGDALMAQHRPEHDRVAELTRAEESYNKARAEVSRWASLGRRRQALLSGATALVMLSGFLLVADFILTEKVCFRKFSIRDKITESRELGGLDGNVLNVVILPMGAIVLGLFAIAGVLHWIYTKAVDREARAHLRRALPEPDAKEPVQVASRPPDN